MNVWGIVLAGVITGCVTGFFVLVTAWLVAREARQAAKVLADALLARERQEDAADMGAPPATGGDGQQRARVLGDGLGGLVPPHMPQTPRHQDGDEERE